MRRFLPAFLAILLVGCSSEPKISEIPEIQPPENIILKNSENKQVGIATKVRDGVWAAADHGISKFENLIDSGEFRILGRDFEKNLVLLEKNREKSESKFSDHPPAVGEDVFWFDGSQSVQTQVESVASDSARFSISGKMRFSHAGAPVFDKNGEIFGILVGANASQNRLFALRSDWILDFLDEN